MARRLAVVVTLALPALAVAQRAPRADARPAAYTAVREVDLRRDVGEMAAPGMRGREGGTLDELRASIRVAERYRRIGLEPMGDDGTYFQWFDIVRTRVSATASRIGASPKGATSRPGRHRSRAGEASATSDAPSPTRSPFAVASISAASAFAADTTGADDR